MLKSIFCPKDLSNVQAISHGKGKDEKMIPLQDQHQEDTLMFNVV